MVTRAALLRWLAAYGTAIDANKDLLTSLDMAIGDGDHGANMHRGFQAVLAKMNADASAGCGALLKTAGMTLVSTVGGASGPLYGTLFLQMGNALGTQAEVSPTEFAAALRRGVDGVIARGKAAVGEKTMIDVLAPACDALEAGLSRGADLADALREATSAADEGLRGTIPMIARKGRASYLGERSAGHPDPGATSAHLLIKAAADSLA